MNARESAGLATMTRIDVRTGWKGLLGWTLGLIATMAMTAVSIKALYDTPEKLQGYAESITGGALLVINGKVAGIGTLGGVFANEFGFILSFGLPIMAIALTSRATRKDEESGRMELLLASSIGRHAPLLAAVMVATAALVVTGLGCAVAMAAAGADVIGSLLYGAGITALGFVFVSITAVVAQLVEHQRTVWGITLTTVLACYLLRGLGAVYDNFLLWLSPHGWVDEVRAFGDARAWPLLIAAIVGLALLALAFWLTGRRDVGSAFIQPRPSSPEASALLKSPVGLAWHQHRGSIIGWSVGAATLMGVYGSLSQEVLDAIAKNPDLAVMMGAQIDAAADQLLRSVMSMFLMMQAMVSAAFALMAVGSLAAEEEAGRLEAELSGDRPRWKWLGTHVAVVSIGALVVALTGVVSLAATSAVSTGDSAWFGDIMRGSAPYLAAVALFGALAVAVFGLASRLRGLGWSVFTVAALVAYLGPGFDFPDWVINASPFQSVGADVLTDGADVAGVVTLSVIAAALVVLGFVAFRRRDVPVG